MDNYLIALVFISLILLNVFQFVYWSREVQKLIDKLMSGSYVNYVQTNQLAQKSKSDTGLRISKEDLESQIEEQQILDELNGMLK